jgi:hypothetical protein
MIGRTRSIQVAGQKVLVGAVHARKVVHVHIDETTPQRVRRAGRHRRAASPKHHGREQIQSQTSDPTRQCALAGAAP